MQNPLFDLYRASLENVMRLQRAQLEFWSHFWLTSTQNAGRTSEEVARAAASQVSRAAGAVSESAEAANEDRKRKSA